MQISEGASGNRVQGNLIGTGATGAVALGNEETGVRIDQSPNNLVGGTAIGEGNVIAYNQIRGISISGAAATGIGIFGNSVYANVVAQIDLGLDDVTPNDQRRR